jgi:hypothetical protein
MMIRALAVALLLPTMALASPGRYVVQCTAACTASDGTSQPAGTNIIRVLADPATFAPGAGLVLVPDTGQALYAPPAPAPLTIDALAFIRRFTSTEQQTLQAADPLWGLQIAAAGMINVTDPTLLASMQQAVSQGLLTQGRMAQVLNLSVASP